MPGLNTIVDKIAAITINGAANRILNNIFPLKNVFAAIGSDLITHRFLPSREIEQAVVVTIDTHRHIAIMIM